MATQKNQKKYNKQVMQSGLKSNEYIDKNLGLIQDYVTDYSGRTDYWTDKLNNRQLDLLSDKYLAQNANMLRGQAAFGSNSETNRQINENAYSQQNYLANVLNQNVAQANQLQNNELQELMSATELNYENRNQGANAAANVDAANNAWLGAVGKGLESVGGVVKMFPGYGSAIGSAMQGVGGTLSGLADTSSTSLTNDQRQYIGNAWNAVQQSPAFQTGLNNLTGAINNWNVNRKYGNVGDFNNSTGVFG
mgnify:CR=1 FL=1